MGEQPHNIEEITMIVMKASFVRIISKKYKVNTCNSTGELFKLS